MTLLMETVESQTQASHCFHRRLEISPTPRDFHIPSAPTTTTVSGKPKHNFSPVDVKCPGLRRGKIVRLTTGASRARGLLSYLTQPTPVWVTSLNELTGFRGSVEIGLTTEPAID